MSYGGRAFWDASVTLTPSSARLHNEKSIISPYEGDPLDLTIYVSCYNEEAFIIATLNAVVEAMSAVGKSYEILVNDDCSKDRSVELVRAYMQQHPELGIVLRANHKNKGWAQNYADSSFLGRGKYFRAICGDNSEPVDTMIDVFKAMGDADIIVPYYVSFEGKSQYRQRISKAYTFLINFITGYRLNYYNGLQVHLRHNVMRWHPNTRGFGFQADLLTRLLDMGFTYKQLPCRTIERRGGRGSAITWINLLSVSHTIFEIVLRRISNRVYKR